MFNFFLVVVVVVVPQDTFWSELRESIEAVWLIDNPVKLENGDFLVRPASHVRC